MFRWLRSGNPYQVIVLLVYAICIKYYYLVHPAPPVINPHSDGILYQYIFQQLQEWHLGSGMYGLLAFVLLFVQAILLNGVINRFKLLPGASYFPAFCYLLFTSFFPEWNTFSAPLLANMVLLLLLSPLLNVYATPQPRSRAFSLGFLVGIAALCYTPMLVFLLFLWSALLVSRPFRLAEWILVLLGIICPFYFLGTVLFLVDKLDPARIIALPLISYPHLLSYPWFMGGAVFLLLWFLYGNIRMQQDLMKMMIHARKCWQILLAFVIIGLVLPFIPGKFSFTGWIITFLPMSVFIALAFWHIKKAWLGLIIHVCALAYIFLVQWVY